jgi:hypothetical protein
MLVHERDELAAGPKSIRLQDCLPHMFCQLKVSVDQRLINELPLASIHLLPSSGPCVGTVAERLQGSNEVHVSDGRVVNGALRRVRDASNRAHRSPEVGALQPEKVLHEVADLVELRVRQVAVRLKCAPE